MQDIEKLADDLRQSVESAENSEKLEGVRISALGRKGKITMMMKELGSISAVKRRSIGATLNKLKEEITLAIEERQILLRYGEMREQLTGQRLDVTLPSRPELTGKVHPVSQVIDEVTAIFANMGFGVAEGPDLEDDFHNFTALNIPPEHPARQMHDTFYLESMRDGAPIVLRTHTSPVQIRHMLSTPPPYRIIAPGRTFRCDSDMTHTPMFHQVEGLAIGHDIHMGHLKGCLEEFARVFFEVDNLRMRFRPSYFPFTEPSAEVDIGCARDGKKLKIGDGDDWLEILGCGMVHPKVLRNVGLDPDEWQGFAFGMGIDRIAMLKYGIPDLRAFFESDLRWLRHYGFESFDVPTLVGGLAR